MEKISKEIKYLVGNAKILENIANVPALPLFSDLAMNFFDELSRKLLSRDMRDYSDVVTLGFWLRRASMEKTKRLYENAGDRIGRGMAFHIAPSNIPIQFAVSLVYALVAGNSSVVRISNKEFPQVDIVCRAINEVIKDMPQIAPYICIARYEHSDAITEKLSSLCDARLIWGGDNTVKSIRRAPIAPRSVDFAFADRYSLAVIDADEYLNLDHKRIATDFYNDTYFSDQNACSSPRMVVWVGEKISEAKKIFWETLKIEIDKKYQMADISSSNKLLTTTLCAARYDGVKEIKEDNTLVRLELPALFEDIMDYKENSGYFFEYNAKNLEELVPLFKKECQTITYIGNLKERLKKTVMESGARGVDRIVPVGRGMELSFVWDGIDLPKALSRVIEGE